MMMKEQQEDRGLLAFIAFGCSVDFDFNIFFITFYLYFIQEGPRVQGGDKVGCTGRPSPFRALFAGKTN